MPADNDAASQVRRVTTAAVRAVAASSQIEISYSGNDAEIRGGRVRLPAPPDRLSADELRRLRGTADRAALQVRYHDGALHQRRRPGGDQARGIFDALEQTRLQALGCRDLAGVALNLDSLLEHICRIRGYEFVDGRDERLAADAVSLIVRERLTGMKLPAAAAPLVDPWRSQFQEKAAPALQRLAATIADQGAFASAALMMMQTLGLISDDDPALENEDESDAASDDDERENDRQKETPGRDQSLDVSAAATTGSESEQGEADAPAEIGEDVLAGQSGERPAGPQPRRNRRLDDPEIEPAQYRPYTTSYDEIVDADRLCDDAELSRLRTLLDQQLAHAHLRRTVPENLALTFHTALIQHGRPSSVTQRTSDSRISRA